MPIIFINNICNYDNIPIEHFDCISTYNLSNLSSILNKYMLLSNSIENTRIIILNQLIKLGFNIKHKGTKYIIESVLILKFYYKSDKIKDIYCIIAQRYNTTSNNIKSNILKSINYVYCETVFSKLKMYFSLVEDIKPTPKQVILTLLKNI